METAAQQTSTKKCPQCFKEFSCSTSDCWCGKLPQVMPVDLKASCLCPECLEKAVSTYSVSLLKH